MRFSRLLLCVPCKGAVDSIEQVSADGAYDGEPTYDAIAARDADIAVVIPPRDGAVLSAQFEREPTQRDM